MWILSLYVCVCVSPVCDLHGNCRCHHHLHLSLPILTVYRFIHQNSIHNSNSNHNLNSNSNQPCSNNQFAKETRNGKYRAYARGCIELCEKYSKSAVTARSALEEAPCDIKRLEILLPSNGSVPNMGERYDAAIAKEKPFESVTQPVLSESAKAKAGKGGKKEAEVVPNDEDGVVKKAEKSKRKKRAKKVIANETDLKNTAALDEKDEVSEGINWSESESDDDKGESESEDNSVDESD